MKSILKKTTSFAAATVALVIGGAIAGLGLAMVAVLAVFALAVFGLALLAALFVQPPDMGPQDIEGTLTGEDIQSALRSTGKAYNLATGSDAVGGLIRDVPAQYCGSVWNSVDRN